MELELEACRLVHRDGLWQTEDDRVGAGVSPAGVFVGRLDFEWPSPALPVRILKELRHVPPLPQAFDCELTEALSVAYQRWERAAIRCRYCNQSLAPGQMGEGDSEADVCHGCGEQHLGWRH